MSNPYNFVPFTAKVDRSKLAKGHDSLKLASRSGYLECQLEVKTPLCIKGPNDNPFWRDDQDPATVFIPGTSIKGMVRTICETIDGGCGAMIGNRFGPYKKSKTDKYEVINCNFGSRSDLEPCSEKIKEELAGKKSEEERRQRIKQGFDLCTICSLFGFTAEEVVLKGRLTFCDTEPSRNQDITLSTLRIQQLMNPQPHHQAFYFHSGTYKTGYTTRKERSGKQIFNIRTYQGGEYSGRKFYLHTFPENIVTKGNIPVTVVDKAAKFYFKVYFENLIDSELALLLFALQLEDGWCHKLGYGKPLGLGSIKIKILSLQQRNPNYFNDFSEPGFLDKTDDITSLVNSFATKIKSQPLYPQLKAVLEYKNNHLDYPDRNWFANNPQATIEQFNSLRLKMSGTMPAKVPTTTSSKNTVPLARKLMKTSMDQQLGVKRISNKGKVFIEVEGKEIEVDYAPSYPPLKAGEKIKVRIDKESTGKINATFKGRVY